MRSARAACGSAEHMSCKARSLSSSLMLCCNAWQRRDSDSMAIA